MYYKVLTSDNKSLGLRNNPNIMQFSPNIWVYEPSPLFGNKDMGGIWVANGYSNAKKLKKYMFEKHHKNCKVYLVHIGDVLYKNSYRVKTNKVKLIKEVL